MKQAGLIPTSQSDALAREIEQQLRDEAAAVMAGAEREARALVAQARTDGRARMHAAILDLRREGERRRARAEARRDTQARARVQQQARLAVVNALPLLRDMLRERWREAQSRKRWMDAAIQVSIARLRHNKWLVEHTPDWSEAERSEFTEAICARRMVDIAFKAESAVTAGLRIRADLAVLDVTPDGLLADTRTVAALLLDEIAGGHP